MLHPNALARFLMENTNRLFRMAPLPDLRLYYIAKAI